MIIDNVKNIENYKGTEKIYDVLKFILKSDFTKMDLGKYFIDGDNLFFMVQEYYTKPVKNVAEAHKEYIDIQLVIGGEELIGYAPITAHTGIYEVKEGKDCTLYNCETVKLLLKAGDFMVLYPNDLHEPGLANGVSSKCQKVVFKIKI